MFLLMQSQFTKSEQIGHNPSNSIPRAGDLYTGF